MAQLEPTDDDLREIEAMQSLDELMDGVIEGIVASKRSVPSKAARRTKPEGLMKLDSTYKDPANWNVTGIVKLVHRDDSGLLTLCGDFVEHYHKTVKTARKLQRIDLPEERVPFLEEPTRIEYVTDRWYIERLSRPQPAGSSTVHFDVTLDCQLEGGYSAGERTLRCIAVRGTGIARAELGAGGARFTNGKAILYLPQGLDVLEGLTRDCKLKVKEAFDREAA